MDKEKKEILLGVLVPVLLITGLVGLSQINLNKEVPSYDFLYFINSNNSYYYDRDKKDEKYRIENGKIEIYDESVINDIRLYDVSKEAYSRVSMQELESMTLETQSVSKDGFSLDYGTRADVDFLLIPIPSVRRDYSQLYLKKEGTSIKLNLGGNYYYNQRDMFIGWVDPVE